MTTTAHEDQFTPAPVEVTQADRDAASAYFEAVDLPKSLRSTNARLGRMDHLPTVQAFARHRTASAPAGDAHPPAPADLVELVEVCRRILDRGYICASIEEERDDYEALRAALAKHGGA